MSSMDSENILKTYDGKELYINKQFPTYPKAVALIVHGMSEHQGRYDYLASRLLSREIAVYRFDHRGHGRSEGRRTYIPDYGDFIQDIHAAVKMIKEELPKQPVFVIGHSMGGYAAALYGTACPGVVDGFILSAALTRYSQHAPQRVLEMEPEETIPNIFDEAMCSDPKVVENFKNDPFVEDEISVSLYHNFDKGVKYLKANPEKFVDPVLVMHGTEDTIVPEQDSREFFSEIATEDKSLYIYAKMRHAIFDEYERVQVIGDVTKWIERRLGGLIDAFV